MAVCLHSLHSSEHRLAQRSSSIERVFVPHNALAAHTVLQFACQVWQGAADSQGRGVGCLQGSSAASQAGQAADIAPSTPAQRQDTSRPRKGSRKEAAPPRTPKAEPAAEAARREAAAAAAEAQKAERAAQAAAELLLLEEQRAAETARQRGSAKKAKKARQKQRKQVQYQVPWHVQHVLLAPSAGRQGSHAVGTAAVLGHPLTAAHVLAGAERARGQACWKAGGPG